MLVPCLGGGEVARERTGKVQDSDTPPREQFSLSHVILAEQILSTIYGKSAILHNYDGLGSVQGLSPGFLVGAQSSMFHS